MQKFSQKITIFLSVREVALSHMILTWISETNLPHNILDVREFDRDRFTHATSLLGVIDDVTDPYALNFLAASVGTVQDQEIPVLTLGENKVLEVGDKLPAVRYIALPLNVTRSIFLHEFLRATRRMHEKPMKDSGSLGVDQRVIRMMGGYVKWLNRKELMLVEGFLKTKNKQLSHEQVVTLFQDVTSESYNKKNLEARICRLRRKLKDAGAPCDCIVAIKNWGYELRI